MRPLRDGLEVRPPQGLAARQVQLHHAELGRLVDHTQPLLRGQLVGAAHELRRVRAVGAGERAPVSQLGDQRVRRGEIRGRRGDGKREWGNRQAFASCRHVPILDEGAGVEVVEERLDVAGDDVTGRAVPRRQIVDDGVDLAGAIAQGDDGGGGVAQTQASLGREEHGATVPRVGLDAGLARQARLHEACPTFGRTCLVSHKASATASSIDQRMWHLSMRARTQASCSMGVVACFTTNASASSASRVARGTRDRKYASAAWSTHG